MKKLVKTTISTLIVLLFCFNVSQAQKSYRVSHDLSFEDDSNTEEIVINVKSGQKRLSINATCNVKFGDVSIEIYDPKGVKQKHITIGSKVRPKAPKKEIREERKKVEKAASEREIKQLEKKLQAEVTYAKSREEYGLQEAFFYGRGYSRGGVRGQVDEMAKNPAAGKWIVKIVPKNATATVSVRVSQSK